MYDKFVLNIINQMTQAVFWHANNNFTQQIYLSSSFEEIWGRPCNWMISNISNWYLTIYPEDTFTVNNTIQERILKKPDCNVIMYRIVLPNNKIHYIREICCKTSNNTFVGFSENLTTSAWEYLMDNINLLSDHSTFNVAIISLLKILFSNNQILSTTHNKIQQNITHRELECIKGLIQGSSSKKIAKIMQISPRTVDDYIEKIKKKFQCSSRLLLISKLKDYYPQLNNKTTSLNM